MDQLVCFLVFISLDTMEPWKQTTLELSGEHIKSSSSHPYTISIYAYIC